MNGTHPLVAAVRPVVDAVGATLVPPDEREAGDVPLVWDGQVVAAVRMPPLHGALDRLIDVVETELGGRLPDLVREDKQRAVRLLDERGAFTLRRAVEHVADAMGVSRITVYNYLERDPQDVTRFEVVGLDADDTLWHSEDSFARVEERFVELVTPYASPGVDVAAALRATERAHLPISGYGVKSFTLAMIKAAVNVSEGRAPASVFGQLVDLGLAMLTEDVRLLPDVPGVLADLAHDHRLVLITKGDLVHQTRKVEMSGIAHHFELVEVVLEKNPETYARILRQLGVAPEHFCMVGNSVRSDILPVLGLGGHAVHIPYPLLWEHEHVDHDEDLDELASIKELPAALRAAES